MKQQKWKLLLLERTINIKFNGAQIPMSKILLIT